MLLALIGPRWDRGEQLRRLRKAQDWVRWEIIEAARLDMMIIPVFLGRSAALDDDVPHELRDLLTRRLLSTIRRTHLRTDIADLADRISTVPDAPSAVTPPQVASLSVKASTPQRSVPASTPCCDTFSRNPSRGRATAT